VPFGQRVFVFAPRVGGRDTQSHVRNHTVRDLVAPQADKTFIIASLWVVEYRANRRTSTPAGPFQSSLPLPISPLAIPPLIDKSIRIAYDAFWEYFPHNNGSWATLELERTHSRRVLRHGIHESVARCGAFMSCRYCPPHGARQGQNNCWNELNSVEGAWIL